MSMPPVLVAGWFPGSMRAVAPLAAAFDVLGWRTRVLTTVQARSAADRVGIPESSITIVRPLDVPASTAALRAVAPALLVFGWGEGSLAERALLAEARRLGVPTLGVLDTWGDFRARLGGEPRVDVLAVMNEAARREILDAGIYAADAIFVAGHPGLEEFLQEEIGPRLPTDRLVVTFFSQPIAQSFGGALGYTQYDALRALAACLDRGSELVVAAHPRDDAHALGAAAAGRGRVLTSYDPAALYRQSNVVVSSFSACLVEAALALRPAVSVQPGLVGADRCWANRLSVSEAAFDGIEVHDALGRAKTIGASPDELRRRRAKIDLQSGSVERICRLAEGLLMSSRRRSSTRM
jgi:hypothetical protein